MKKELSLKKALSVSCPTCGAAPNKNVNSVRVSPGRIPIEIDALGRRISNQSVSDNVLAVVMERESSEN